MRPDSRTLRTLVVLGAVAVLATPAGAARLRDEVEVMKRDMREMAQRLEEVDEQRRRLVLEKYRH